MFEEMTEQQAREQILEMTRNYCEKYHNKKKPYQKGDRIPYASRVSQITCGSGRTSVYFPQRSSFSPQEVSITSYSFQPFAIHILFLPHFLLFRTKVLNVIHESYLYK